MELELLEQLQLDSNIRTRTRMWTCSHYGINGNMITINGDKPFAMTDDALVYVSMCENTSYPRAMTNKARVRLF